MDHFDAQNDLTHCFFIVSGSTRDAILRYERDRLEAQSTAQEIARTLGAQELTLSTGMFVFNDATKIDPELFIPYDDKQHPPGYNPRKLNLQSERAQAIDARLADIPLVDWNFRIFAQRLTGRMTVRREGEDFPRKAASFQKVGGTYILSIPRVQGESWFKPEGCTPITRAQMLRLDQ